MKISKEKRETNTSKRTIKAFVDSMIVLLQSTKLEKITISMLCDESTYPRSTFYNYFEDVYDLIDFMLEGIFNQISLNEFITINPEVRSMTLFGKAYDVLNQYREVIENILIVNGCNSVFMQRVRNSMRSAISDIIVNSECIKNFPVSNEIMQYHYSYTIENVLEHCFMSSKPITKVEALKTLDFLLGTLEREVNNYGK